MGMTKNPPETPEEKSARETIESIAMNIAQLSRQVSALLTGRLKKKSLVILLAHSTGLNQAVVTKVLDAVADLESTHLN